MNKALLIVDLQHDFLPRGALAVADGDRVINPIYALTDVAREQGDLIVASRDWHPAGHCSFAHAGGTWPEHCVAGTPGAALHRAADAAADLIVSKGTRKDKDAYSAFDGTELAAMLRPLYNGGRHVQSLVVCGLATDYCVKATVMDALAYGFKVTVPTDAVAAVDVEDGDGWRALKAMQQAGAVIV